MSLRSPTARRFRDRREAGQVLAQLLGEYRDRDVIVLGLPRGGVPVAYEIARTLGAPLDILLVRKVGVPYQSELAMAALAEGGVLVRNEDVLASARVSDADFARVRDHQAAELARQAAQFRPVSEQLDIAGHTVIVVDDGIATGATVKAACQVARARHAREVVVATPVAVDESVSELAGFCDHVVCVKACDGSTFFGVGSYYDDFSPTEDADVVAILAKARALRGHQSSATPQVPAEDLSFDVAHGTLLEGTLVLPAGATGLIVFAHGSGSSRHSPRNRFLADRLNQSGFGTLLFDLLTTDEEQDRANVFDIETLGSRLHEVTRQVRSRAAWIGYFGGSTGAAAALWAAAQPDANVGAVVSRGGRPDLALPWLDHVSAPTLLIVGSRDVEVLALNRTALARLSKGELEIVAGATHLFEEPGTLQQVAELTCAWFTRWEPEPAQSSDGRSGRRHWQA